MMNLYPKLKNFAPPEKAVRSGSLYEAAVEQIDKKIGNHRDTIVTAAQLLSMKNEKGKNSDKSDHSAIVSASQLMQQINQKNQMNSKKTSFKRNTMQQQSLKSYFSCKNDSEIEDDNLFEEISTSDENNHLSAKISDHNEDETLLNEISMTDDDENKPLRTKTSSCNESRLSSDLDAVFTRKRKLSSYSGASATSTCSTDRKSSVEEGVNINDGCVSAFEEYAADTRRKSKRVSHLAPRPSTTPSYLKKKYVDCFGSIDSSDDLEEETISAGSSHVAQSRSAVKVIGDSNQVTRSDNHSASEVIECSSPKRTNNELCDRKQNEDLTYFCSSNDSLKSLQKDERTSKHTSSSTSKYLEKVTSLFGDFDSVESFDSNILTSASCDSGIGPELSQLTSGSEKTNPVPEQMTADWMNFEVPKTVAFVTKLSELKKNRKTDFKNLFENESIDMISKDGDEQDQLRKKSPERNKSSTSENTNSAQGKGSLKDKTNFKNGERRKHLGINRYHTSSKKIKIVGDKEAKCDGELKETSPGCSSGIGKKTKFVVRDSVMKYLEPYYRTSISDKNIFKSAARSIVHKVAENYDIASE